MKLTFSWMTEDGCFTPHCESSSSDSCLLSSILLDDGGLDRATSVEWVEIGCQKTDAVINGELASYDWGRETWAATIETTGVTIYSLHDETVFQQFDLERFYNALSGWMQFLKSSPSADAIVTITI